MEFSNNIKYLQINEYKYIEINLENKTIDVYDTRLKNHKFNNLVSLSVTQKDERTNAFNIYIIYEIQDEPMSWTKLMLREYFTSDKPVERIKKTLDEIIITCVTFQEVENIKKFILKYFSSDLIVNCEDKSQYINPICDYLFLNSTSDNCNFFLLYKKILYVHYAYVKCEISYDKINSINIVKVIKNKDKYNIIINYDKKPVPDYLIEYMLYYFFTKSKTNSSPIGFYGDGEFILEDANILKDFIMDNC
jgi:predicted transcriptional regulator YdeE